MKWRIVLAVMFVLTLFSCFAYLYVNTFVRKRQHAVILFVVDGFDLSMLNQARLQLGRSPFDTAWNVALLNLQDPGQPVPDAGVDATAIACGKRVPNGFVAVTRNNEALESLIYIAEQSQRATGLVTTSSLVQPAPVAFYSTIKGGMPEPYRNAGELLYSHINIILGGGEQYFTPANATNELGRRDPKRRDLLDEAQKAGYTVVRTRDELEHAPLWDQVPPWGPREIFGVFAPDQFYFSSLQPVNRRQPTLAEMTRIAITSLNHNIGGYFLVVQHGLVARAAEQNLGKLAVNEVEEVNEAINTAVEYAGSDALVVVTNGYSLGAISPMLPADGDLSAPVPTVDANGNPVKPALPPSPPLPPMWLAGPGGPVVTKEQASWLGDRYQKGVFRPGSALQEPEAALRFQTMARPLSEPAWVAARGEGSADVRGFLDNTDLFGIISGQF